MYVTLQLPAVRVQVVELNVPVEFVVKETDPVGVTAPVPEVSVTVAVQVEAWLSGTLGGAHVTVVEVVLTVKV